MLNRGKRLKLTRTSLGHVISNPLERVILTIIDNTPELFQNIKDGIYIIWERYEILNKLQRPFKSRL